MSRILSLGDVFGLALRHSRTAISNARIAFEPLRLAEILTAIARHESNFDADAKNKNSSASGLMQILTGTQKAIEKRLKLLHQSPSKRFDADYSMMLAANEFVYQLARYGMDAGKAVIAYNQGNWSPKTQKRAVGYLAEINKNLVRHRPVIERLT